MSVTALVDVLQFEIARAERHGLGIAPGDEPGLDTADPCERNAGAVMSVKAFGLHHYPLAGPSHGDRKEEKLAVGENAIDIEEQKFNFAGAGLAEDNLGIAAILAFRSQRSCGRSTAHAGATAEGRNETQFRRSQCSLSGTLSFQAPAAAAV